jgi:hypothetical protein
MAFLKESFRHENWCMKVLILLIKCIETHDRASTISNFLWGYTFGPPLTGKGNGRGKMKRWVEGWGKGRQEINGVGRRGWDKEEGRKDKGRGGKQAPGFLHHPDPV